MSSPVVHMLTGQTKQSKIGKAVCATKCGFVSERNAAAPLPPEVSGWRSATTCIECLEVMS